MHVKDSSQISASKSKISKVSAIPIFPLINWWNTEIIFMHVENTAKILLQEAAEMDVWVQHH